MTPAMGPVLGFREAVDGIWRVSVLVVTTKDHRAAKLTATDPALVSGPVELMTHKNDVVLRYDLDVEQGLEGMEVAYGFEVNSWSFWVPGTTENPNSAFVSCNGFSDPKEMKSVDDKNAMWSHLQTLHDRRPYHLLLMGGDQVYADPIWLGTELEKWRNKWRSDRRESPFFPAMQAEVSDFYFNLYKARWAATLINSEGEEVPSNPETADMLSRVPTIMMWDDHDIFDGWGSYADEDQNCPVYQGIFAEARKHFAVFQQQIKADGSEKRPSVIDGQGHFNLGIQAGRLAILALDTRSERSQDQVMSLESWNAVWDWADDLPASGVGGPEHLLVISPVPVVHADFGSIEGFYNFLPGEQELEDDLRDHWQSRPHRSERSRMIHRLFSLMSDKKIRATILSGDVHVAALGTLETSRSGRFGSREQVINQLTSSGIVHPSPPRLMSFMLENLSAEPETVDQGIVATMQNFPDRRKKFVLSRNFLSLEPDRQGRIWANWYLEEDIKLPATKVINPIDHG